MFYKHIMLVVDIFYKIEAILIILRISNSNFIINNNRIIKNI